MTDSIVKDLESLLADYQVFYQKLRGYHWNVRGPQFFELHAKFEELYTEAALRVDGVAERLAARGAVPPSTMAGQLTLARLQEDGEPRPADQMVRAVVGDMESLSGWLRTAAAAAGNENDVATANLLEGWADADEQTQWMLRAYLA